MQKLIARFEQWLWNLEQRHQDRFLQAHFARLHPDSITDIDKYLRDHRWLQ